MSIFCVIFLLCGVHAAGFEVAVVGSGIGGSSTAYFAKELLGADVNVTVYEASERIGGRMKHLDYFGDIFEVGASIVYDGNLYVKDMAKKLELETRKPPHMGGRMGIWNGSEFVFEESGWKAATLMKMVWRYGYGALSAMKNIVLEMLGRFVRIYDFQSDGKVFEDWESLWRELDLHQLTQISLDSFMEARMGADGDVLTDEIIEAVNRVNYNQGNGLNALAGSISLCPLVTGELFCLKNGNSELSRRALEHAEATVLVSSPVRTVEAVVANSGDVRYRVWAQQQGGPVAVAGVFDAVVLATPLELTDISFRVQTEEAAAATDREGSTGIGEGESEEVVVSIPPRSFQVTHSTFVRGALRPEAFGLERLGDLPDTILTIGGTSPFSSLSVQRRFTPAEDAEHGFIGSAGDGNVDGDGDGDGSRLYKIFSRTELSEEQLSALFTWHNVVESVDWSAYPRFQPPETFAPLRLPLTDTSRPERVYYLNSLETAASALEVSAIGGKNIALLLQQDLVDVATLDEGVVRKTGDADVRKRSEQNVGKPEL